MSRKVFRKLEKSRLVALFIISSIQYTVAKCVPWTSELCKRKKKKPRRSICVDEEELSDASASDSDNESEDDMIDRDL